MSDEMNLMEKSQENYDAGLMLRNANLYRASCSRLYYSFFLIFKDICHKKLNYTKQVYESLYKSQNLGSHDAINRHFQIFFDQATFSEDEELLDQIRQFPLVFSTVKNIRRKADYDEENDIDDLKCQHIIMHYQILNNNLANINKIIDANRGLII